MQTLLLYTIKNFLSLLLLPCQERMKGVINAYELFRTIFTDKIPLPYLNFLRRLFWCLWM